MKIFQNRGSILLPALLPLIIILLIVGGELFFHGTTGDSNPTLGNFTEGWRTPDGAELTTSQLPKGIVIMHKSFDNTDTDAMELCFKTSDCNVRVFFDGVVAYDYTFKPCTPLFGMSYGSRIHAAPIPDGASTVTLEIDPLYESMAARISLLSVEESGIFLKDIYHQELPRFSLCALIALFGILMLLVGIMTRRTTESTTIDFFSLGGFAILTGIYSANETLILQIYTDRPDAVRFCAATALIFISYFPVSFIASVTHQRNTVSLPIQFALVVLNFGITAVLSLLGISDVALMLPFAHFNIVTGVVMTSYLMWRAIKKKTNNKAFLQTIITGMSFTLGGAVLDVLRYVLVPARILSNSFFTRVGVLTFVILTGIHLMRERARLAVEKERSALMERLAYTDGLTGLENRLAFNLKENEIHEQHIQCIVVQLDINNLKKVNDVYGHAEGDRHIIVASDILSKAFSELGTCYRTGGDEFIVIVLKGEESDVTHALTVIDEMSKTYNENEKPPVPLQIAYGYAQYSAQGDLLENAEKLADERMYEKKKQMKNAVVA